MIEDVLSDIRAAEERAARIIADAQNRARDIALSSAAAADAVRAEFAIETKRAVGEIMAAAQAKAEKESEAAEKQAQAAAQNVLRAAERNVRGTGEWLFDRLTRGRI
ncbi:MAG: hypothetical protein HFE46_00490 [Clostridia bacterium]|nr:hypothetical protein [Clostridia bacterium]